MRNHSDIKSRKNGTGMPAVCTIANCVEEKTRVSSAWAAWNFRCTKSLNDSDRPSDNMSEPFTSNKVGWRDQIWLHRLYYHSVCWFAMPA